MRKLKTIKNPKRYKVMRPETFGLPFDAELTFVQSTMGYVAPVAEDAWIGMPSWLVENNPRLFKKQRNRIPHVTNEKVVGRH